MSVKLASINIEGDKHLKKRVLPFLEKEMPDVVCLQEVFEEDVQMIKDRLKMEGTFVPLVRITKDNPHQPPRGIWGIMILSKLPISREGFEYYYVHQNKKDLPKFFDKGNPNSMHRAVAWIKVSHEGEEYTLATTHFTWSPDGKTTELQKNSQAKLLKILDRFPDLVLCGDLNAPRGREIFSRFAEKYKDNIPQDEVTTIDNNLHKAPFDINFVVDGLFSSPEYQVSDVKVVAGVSDHKGIVAQIKKLPK